MPNILLIEDNPEIRESMAEILELSGHTILKAPNGKVGVTMAREHRPDLIICDVMMPELDGFGVISLLSKDPLTQKIPFIFLTSKMAAQDLRKGMNLGADDYLTKPFELSELLRAIEIRLQKASNRQTEESHAKLNPHLSSLQKYQKQFEEWTHKFEERIIQDGQILTDTGNQAVFLYWLTEGILQLQQEPIPGRLFIRQLQAPPYLLGLEACLNSIAQPEQAISLNMAKVRAIPVEDFKQFLQEKPLVMRYLLQLISSQAIEQQNFQAAYAFASVRKRVALSLLRIHAIFEDQEIDFPRERLASFSGVSRGGLMRVLAEFREDNYLEINNSKLRIIEPSSLAQITE